MPTPVQRSQSHNQDVADDDEAVPNLMDKPAPPRAIVYFEPSFSLERPVCRLEMDKRLKVYNHYISAISNRMHKVDLISRLKKSEPHNADYYQRQFEQQLVQHDDVIHRLVDTMKTDDYFRTMEDLPMIDPCVAYEEVEQFPELFDAKEAVSRISTEVDIIERQMHWPGMYPILQSPVHATSGFVPHRPTSTFKLINPAMLSHAAHQQQGQLHFVQPRVNPQGQPIRQPR